MAVQHVYYFLFVCAYAATYDFSRTSVRSLTTFNFDEQVNKQRAKFPAIVHFYRERDRLTTNLVEELNSLAMDWQGAFVVGAVNCAEQEKLCEDQDIRSTPFVRVFPPLPAPTHEYEAEVSSKRMISYLASYITSRVTDINQDNIKDFLASNPSTPKVFLFTEKPGLPTIYKALSNTLGDTLDFGIIRSDETSLTAKYGVKTFPQVMIVRSTDSKPRVFEGEMKYRQLFEFLNIYSEVFVIGGKDTEQQPKPWKADPVPELTKASSQDICFSKEGVICAIFFTSTKPSENQIDLFKAMKSRFTSRLEDRGADVTFMWVSTTEEPGFLAHFEGLEPPALVFLKHGKRNRYSAYTGPLTESGIENELAKIMGGDAKFANVKGKFPSFSDSRK